MRSIRTQFALSIVLLAAAQIGFAPPLNAADPVFDTITVETLPAKPGKHWLLLKD